MSTPSLPKLPLFGTTALSSSVPSAGSQHHQQQYLACNPAIDLTAAVGDGGAALHVWRSGDQSVSKYVERGRRVEAVRWKGDGTFLLPILSSLPLFYCLFSLGIR
jgi:anaphase-promoting complex subunit 4